MCFHDNIPIKHIDTFKKVTDEIHSLSQRILTINKMILHHPELRQLYHDATIISYIKFVNSF